MGGRLSSSPRPRSQASQHCGHSEVPGVLAANPSPCAGAEDVQLGGHPRAAERQVKENAVFRRHHGVLIGLEEEGGRGLRRDLLLVGNAADQLGRRIGPQQVVLRGAVGEGLAHADDGVAEDGKIGSATGALDRVVGRGLALVEVRGGGRGQVAAGRKAHDADVVDGHFPLVGPSPHRADGPLGICQRGRVAVAAAAMAIIEHDAGDAQGVEPGGDLAAFVVGADHVVAAAGADDHGGAVGPLGRGQPDRQRGFVGGRISLGVGGAVGPEQDGGRVGGPEGRPGGRGAEGRKAEDLPGRCREQAVFGWHGRFSLSMVRVHGGLSREAV